MEQRRRQLQTNTKDLNNITNANVDDDAAIELKPFLNVLLKAKLDGRELKFREIFEEISTFIFTVCKCYKGLIVIFNILKI